MAWVTYILGLKSSARIAIQSDYVILPTSGVM